MTRHDHATVVERGINEILQAQGAAAAGQQLPRSRTTSTRSVTQLFPISVSTILKSAALQGEDRITARISHCERGGATATHAAIWLYRATTSEPSFMSAPSRRDGERGMRHSTERILSTHGGSLPRPDDFDEMIAAKAPVSDLQKRLPSAVQEVVDEQISSGLDVINDGEFVKAASGSYAAYILDRVTGWGPDPDPDRAPKRAGTAERDHRVFPGVYESGLWLSGSGPLPRPGFFKPGPPRTGVRRVCDGPVQYVGQDAIKADTDALAEALEGKDDVEGFIAALGPLSLGAGSTNLYYPSEEEYMMAVAEVVHEEYKAITDAGYIVQIDEPEFATTWSFYPDWSVEDLRKYLSFAVEVINHALEGLPEDQVRFHVCWGSGHRPHTTDIPLEAFADLMLKINAQAYSVEASNVRHAHEYRVWEKVKLPDGKILVPGVISHATDLVEHPELVAERLINFADIVGKENVQASTDCGIGYRVGHAEIVWAKLRSMSEGCRIASEKLFS